MTNYVRNDSSCVIYRLCNIYFSAKGFLSNALLFITDQAFFCICVAYQHLELELVLVSEMFLV